MKRLASPTLRALALLFLATFALPIAVSANPVNNVSDCELINDKATATRNDVGQEIHSYSYTLTQHLCKGGNVQVTGSINIDTGQMREELAGSGGSISGVWNCSQDPWVYAAPRCTRLSGASTGGDPKYFDNDAFASNTIPVSVAPLSAQQLDILAYDINVARMSLPPPPPLPAGDNGLGVPPPPPAPTPTPTPAPSGVQYHVPLLVNGWPLVDLNASGAAVRAAFDLLQAQDANFAIPVGRSSFQDADQAEVRAFQQANGLPVTGVVDSATWPSLIVTVQQGDQGSAVSAVQEVLRFEDVVMANQMVITVDGNFGDQTDAAVRLFQQSQNLTVDGDVGPETWQSLLTTVK